MNVKFFLDTADLAEIEEAASWGALAGVTTNPTLYARIGGKLDDFHAHIKRICDIVGPDCPVSAESVAMTRDEIVRDGRELAKIAPNVVVKIPTMVEGLAATRQLADEGIPVNMTLCFTVPQAILAARAGARYISPFVGRFDDISEDGLAQLEDVVTAIGNYDFSADTVNAAVALNVLGKGADIDADGLIKSFAKAEKKAEDGLTLGQYGRFIMALTAAGIDCTKAQIGGKTRNLVVEMEKLTADADPTVEEAVYLLPVYGNDNYRNISGTTPEGLIEIILDAQGENGFFWADEKAETYSIPLTSQALLALVPYLDDELVDKKVSDEVADAVAAASEALYDAQLIDGSWPADGLALEGDIPATAYATTALVALGADPTKDLKTSNDSTPLGYLTAHADKALDGYTDAEGVAKKDEPVVAATVLMALAANKGYAEAKDAFDVYDVREVKRPEAAAAKAKTTPTRSPSSSTYRSTTATKTIPQSGDELPWTMAFTGTAAALSLAAAVLARRRLTE